MERIIKWKKKILWYQHFCKDCPVKCQNQSFCQQSNSEYIIVSFKNNHTKWGTVHSLIFPNQALTLPESSFAKAILISYILQHFVANANFPIENVSWSCFQLPPLQDLEIVLTNSHGNVGMGTGLNEWTKCTSQVFFFSFPWQQDVQELSH